MSDTAHKQRIKDELLLAGITKYGLLKQESRYLHRLIHEDEHIDGVIYGHYQRSDSGMLVATDKRVIFLDRKPFFTTSDEITYDVVTGVRQDRGALLTSITLHTRMNNYTFRYVNSKVADKFVAAVEKNIEPTLSQKVTFPTQPGHIAAPLSSSAQLFLNNHNTAVISTVDREGNVHGATVYYVVDAQNGLYILTKSGTGKARNMLAHSQVALTVTDLETMQTLQLEGFSEVVVDVPKQQEVFAAVTRLQTNGAEQSLPPVAKLHEGSFVVIRIHPANVHFSDYKQKATAMAQS